MRGLLIEVKSWYTGERAQGINPRDPNLVALGGPLWQVLDHEPKGDWEIRVVRDNRDLSAYTGAIILDDGSRVTAPSTISSGQQIVDVEGVVVLENEHEINEALKHIPDKFYTDPDATRQWAENKGITPLLVLKEIQAVNTANIKPGYRLVASRRRKQLWRILGGSPIYAWLRRLYAMGCPYIWRAEIPGV